jgi:hypothetical protein
MTTAGVGADTNGGKHVVPEVTGPAMQSDGGVGTGITVDPYGAASGTNAPYVQLLICDTN